MKTIKFLNISNHPASRWSPEQREAALHLAREEARRRGLNEELEVEIVDLQFPEVDPAAGTQDVVRLARELVSQVPEGTLVAMVQGEFTLSHAVVHLLIEKGIPACAATSRRTVVELGDGRKVAEFKFTRFRFYPYLCDEVASR